jgi:hypothetical protein
MKGKVKINPERSIRMKKSVNATLLFALAILMVMAVNAAAQAPNSIIYQGRLTDTDGDAITDSTDVTFEIFAALTGGSNIYNITQKVGPDDNGVFTIELTGVTSTVLNGSKRYLQLTVGTDVLSPRQLLTSAPYAYSAEYADNIPDNSVTTSKIAASGVTNSDIANNAVTGGKVSNGSLTDADILDEPGIASGHNTGSTITLTATDINLDSAVIVTPSSGYVVVIASAYYQPNHVSGTKDLGRFSISETSATINYSNMANITTAANATTDSDMPMPVALHAVYNVASAGTYRYYFTADMYSGAPRVSKARIVAMFFPTAYGVVDEKGQGNYGGTNEVPDPTRSDGGFYEIENLNQE